MDTTLVREEGRAVISLKGRFTTDEAPSFTKVIESLQQDIPPKVVMDLEGLDFVSSAGIRCFVMLHKACSALGSALTLTHLAPQITDILTLTALIDKFNVE